MTSALAPILVFDLQGGHSFGGDPDEVKQVQEGRWVIVWPSETAAPGAKTLTP